jgi:hypothetical protein
MKMNLLKLSFVAVTAAGLASCGGNGGQPLTTTSIPIVMGQFKSQLLGKLPTSNTVNPTSFLPVSGASTNSNASIKAADCETSTPNPVTDADHDDIALLKTSTFNCSDFTSGTNTYSRKGSYTVKDLDDTTAGVLGGMQVDFALERYDYKDNASGEEYHGSYNGFWKYTSDGGGTLNSTSEFRGTFYFSSPNLSFAPDYEYAYTWNWTQTPTNPASGHEWDAGSTSLSGTWSMSGTFVFEDHSGNHEKMTGTYEIKYYSKDLKYDTTCTSWWRSGSYFVDDYNGNIIEVRYACSTAELYVNGVKSDIWTP